MTTWLKRTGGTSTFAQRRGANIQYPYVWDETSRPTTNLFDGLQGYNTDSMSIEVYIESSGKWRVINGMWATATRPDTTDIEPGSMGFNADDGVGLEMWNGVEWVAL